jgi:hypothetical protein
MRFRDVAFRISSFGFYNSQRNPTAFVVVKNSSKDTVVFDLSECYLLAAGKKVPPNLREQKISIGPGRSIRERISFSYILERGEEREKRGMKYYVPEPSQVTFNPGAFLIGGESISIPSVDYMYPPEYR